MKFDPIKISRGLALAAALSAASLAAVLVPTEASAFGFHGGGGFHAAGGFHGGGGFRAGGMHIARGPGFAARPVRVGGGFNTGRGGHFGGRPIGGGRIGWHPGCYGIRCGGPVFATPALVASVGVASGLYFYGDQSIYYRDRLVHAASQCDGSVGTFALVGFVPSATAADITNFLDSYKAAITDGPTLDAVYLIKLADRKMSQDEVQQELASMADQKSVVRVIAQPEAKSARN